jgi:hypothetical protein
VTAPGCQRKKHRPKGVLISGFVWFFVAADAIFAKDKTQGSDHPDGYPIPAAQYFTNKCAAEANQSPSEGTQGGVLWRF